jgi:hypothetical protein
VVSNLHICIPGVHEHGSFVDTRVCLWAWLEVFTIPSSLAHKLLSYNAPRAGTLREGSPQGQPTSHPCVLSAESRAFFWRRQLRPSPGGLPSSFVRRLCTGPLRWFVSFAPSLVLLRRILACCGFRLFLRPFSLSVPPGPPLLLDWSSTAVSNGTCLLSACLFNL